MRRDNKYQTNKTVRYCNGSCYDKFNRSFPEESSIQKHNRWKLLNILKASIQSNILNHKIIIRRHFNFYQYNGYDRRMRANPPKHLSFAYRPNFVYQPNVTFIKVNKDVFDCIIELGGKYSTTSDFSRLFDIYSDDTNILLIYFLESRSSSYSSNWELIYKHAFGGYLADYNMVCSGDYCPFGPRIRGQTESDSRVSHVLCVTTLQHVRQYRHCLCGNWKRQTKADRHQLKKQRSNIKMQRRIKHTLTRNAKHDSLH